ncbi:DUF4167 domain-containing protein [Camelimonas sp. ID_303_24]
MRPGQNRRVRGRSNRKGPNPLTRSYESNGPDVKIRGTAQHIAEKYAQLARDAQVTGDPVASENYLQHAEHYFRIIAAAQAQFQQTYGALPRSFDDADDGELDEEYGVDAPATQRPPQVATGDEAYPASAPQPGQGASSGYRDRQERFERPQRGERYERQERPERQDRPERQERQERPARGERQPRVNAGESGEFRQAGEREPRGRRERFRRDRDAAPTRDAETPVDETDAAAGLPAFLTTPLRAAPAPAPVEAQPEPAVESSADLSVAAQPQEDGGVDETGERFPVRARRRRGRPRAGEAADSADIEQSAAG